jgi:hypothetical protein
VLKFSCCRGRVARQSILPGHPWRLVRGKSCVCLRVANTYATLKRRVAERSQVVSRRLPQSPGALSASSYEVAIAMWFGTCHLVVVGLRPGKGKPWAIIATQLLVATPTHVSPNPPVSQRLDQLRDIQRLLVSHPATSKTSRHGILLGRAHQGRQRGTPHGQTSLSHRLLNPRVFAVLSSASVLRLRRHIDATLPSAMSDARVVDRGMQWI